MKHTFVVITALPDGMKNQILVRTAEYRSFKRAMHYMPMHIGWNDLCMADGEYIRNAFLVGGYAGMSMSDYFPALGEWEPTPSENRPEQIEILRTLHIRCGYTAVSEA